MERFLKIIRYHFWEGLFNICRFGLIILGLFLFGQGVFGLLLMLRREGVSALFSSNGLFSACWGTIGLMAIGLFFLLNFMRAIIEKILQDDSDRKKEEERQPPSGIKFS